MVRISFVITVALPTMSTCRGVFSEALLTAAIGRCLVVSGFKWFCRACVEMRARFLFYRHVETVLCP